MSDVFSELINLGREQSKEQRSRKSRVRRISSGDDKDKENTDSQSKCSVTKGEEEEKYESDRPTGVLSDRPTLQQEQEADLDTTFDSDATHMPESENEDRVIVPETQFLTDADVSEARLARKLKISRLQLHQRPSPVFSPWPAPNVQTQHKGNFED